MTSISNYLPVTLLAFNTLINEKNRKYEIIGKAHPFLGHAGTYAKKGFITVALCLAAVALPIFLLVEAGNLAIQKMGFKGLRLRSDDFHYLFESTVFEAHRKQLAQFIEGYLRDNPAVRLPNANDKQASESGTLLADVHQLIRLIVKSAVPTTEKEKLQFHQQFLEQLRALVRKKADVSNEDDAIKFIDTLCEWLYTKPRLMKEMIQFIEAKLPKGSLDPLIDAEAQNVPSVIQTLHRQLDSDPQFNGIDDSTRLYDPSNLGDVPSHLFSYPIDDQGKTKKVNIIRTPAVTRDTQRNARGDLAEAAIVEEFTGFLDSYKKQNKVHVYFNLMQRHGSEGIRSKLIEKLEEQYPGTLHVVTLTKDFDFYNQKNLNSNSMDAVDFKNQFLLEMFKNSNSHYHWSTALGAQWQTECQQLIDQVHANYFANKISLTKEERLVFIENFYAEVIEAVLNKLKPDSANLSCKSCIDRGASSLGAQYIKRCLSQKQDLTENKRKRLMALFLAPAILAMNRVMELKRIERVSPAIKHMYLQKS